jgi:hypothetical protein
MSVATQVKRPSAGRVQVRVMKPVNVRVIRGHLDETEAGAS